MQDRPTAIELLKGVGYFLADEAIPGLEGTAQFHARVAAHTVRMIVRELEGAEDRLRTEHAGLAELLGTGDPAPAPSDEIRENVALLNEALAEKIRRGEADEGEFRRRVLDHLRRSIVPKLQVANPKMSERLRDELKDGAGP